MVSENEKKELLQQKITELKKSADGKESSKIIEELVEIEKDLLELKIETHELNQEIYNKVDTVLNNLPKNWLVIITPILLMVKTAWEQWQKFTTSHNLDSMLVKVKESLKEEKEQENN